MADEIKELSYMKAKQNLGSLYGMNTDSIEDLLKLGDDDTLKWIGRRVFSDKSSEQVQHIINILSLTALEQILNNKGDHYRECAESAVKLSNGIEFYLRDFSEYVTGLLYGAE